MGNLEKAHFNEKVLDGVGKYEAVKDSLKPQYGELLETIKTGFEKNTDKVLLKAVDVVKSYKGKNDKEIISAMKKESALNYSTQILLQNAGFADGKPGFIDGQYGARTRAAVSKFQEKTGATKDGIVGDETLGKMIDTIENPVKYQALINKITNIPQNLADKLYDFAGKKTEKKATTEKPVAKKEAAPATAANVVPEYAKTIPAKQLNLLAGEARKYCTMSKDAVGQGLWFSNKGSIFTFVDSSNNSNHVEKDLTTYRNNNTWDAKAMVIAAKSEIDAMKAVKATQEKYYNTIEDQEDKIEDQKISFEDLYKGYTFANPVQEAGYRSYLSRFEGNTPIKVEKFDNKNNKLKWSGIGDKTWATNYKDAFDDKGNFQPEKFKTAARYAINKYVLDKKNGYV